MSLHERDAQRVQEALSKTRVVIGDIEGLLKALRKDHSLLNRENTTQAIETLFTLQKSLFETQEAMLRWLRILDERSRL